MKPKLIIAVSMLPALTPRDHSTVPASQDTVVMATIVQVSVLFSAFLPVSFSFVIDPSVFLNIFYSNETKTILLFVLFRKKRDLF